MRLSFLISFISVILLPLQSFALVPGEIVNNFRLLDHTGKSFELYYQRDVKLVAIMIQGVGCPIVRNASHSFKSLRDQFRGDVAFLMLNANLQDTRESIAEEAEEFGMDFPILVDETQLIAESMSLTRTAEVLLIDTSDWTLVYRGAIDNRLGYETQRTNATEQYLADAINATLNHEAVKVAQSPTQGCLINMPGLESNQAVPANLYTQEIAPILLNNCVSCHREGGIGPFAMANYETVRGFAPMIREVIHTQRMPPWHADPHINHFSNDRSLSIAETQTLVHWIENGAPRGAGPDPLTTYQAPTSEWLLGKPDLIVELPPYTVPATGVIDYQIIRIKNPLDKDVWVTGAEILPGSRKVVHHTLVNFGNEPEQAGTRFKSLGRIGGYVPGRVDAAYPENTGVLLPKNTEFEFEMHYTTYGKQETDVTRMGLYFQDERPKWQYHSAGIVNARFKIPPYTKEYWQTGNWTTDKDILLYSLMPHAHFRGKAAKFVAHYPNGEEEVLLSVPNYDFNWQTTYEFDQPKTIPAGTRIEQHIAWDNSELNKANPDPSKEIRWGRQSWDEMLYGVVSYRALSESE